MAEDEPRRDWGLTEDARLNSLDERLKQAQAEEAARTGQTRRAPPTGQAQGMRVLSVLVGYPAGSALIGWLFDRWFGTKWVLAVMLILGVVIAFREIWKISKQPPE